MANENGNGFKNLAREFTATKERTAAWGFRLVLGVGTILLMIIGWFIIDKLGAIDKSREQVWKVVGDLATAQSNAASAVTRLDQTVQDYVRNQDRIIADHEQRIRTLERPQH